MTNDVVLTAALRNNLLSLQQTQKQIDIHQNRLATGKKVNSALDNPQAFFAAQGLTNRANDLSNLLDAIGQSIQVINAANNGVTALSTLINQAQSIANTAQSTLAGSSTQAKVTGATDLGTGKLTTLAGITSGDNLTINVTDPDGGANPILNQVITIGANDTAADLVTKINDLNTTLSEPVISASLDTSHHLVITAINNGSLSVKFLANTPGDAANTATASALGFANIAKLNQNGAAGTNTVDFTQTATNTLSSVGLYTGTGTLAQGSSTLSTLKNSTGTALTQMSSGDTLTISVGGKTSADLLHYAGGTDATLATIQSVVDAINHDSNISSLVSASFDTETGQIELEPLTSAAVDAQFKFSSATNLNKLSLGFGVSSLTVSPGGGAATEEIRFGAAAGSLASLQTQYNTVLAQIDALVRDAGYAGTNLLYGNDLSTYFNESRTSSLTTSGVTFTAAGLGLTEGNFQSMASITQAITETREALTMVRDFGSTLATNLSIIQDRQNFTTDLINTLKTGSDQLTNADQNEEGASLLALQTRQSLGVTSLSLASQAQQAILKLF